MPQSKVRPLNTIVLVAGLAGLCGSVGLVHADTVADAAADTLALSGTEHFAQPADAGADALAQPDPDAPKPDPDSFFRGWEGSVAFGLNGASGNTERFGVRGQFDAKRETSRNITTFGALYVYATDEGEKSEHRGELFGQYEWKVGEDGKWRPFAKAKAEYDEFKDWRWRLSGFVGVGYALIETETTTFVPRIGVGASREFGGSNNDITPELDLGWDFEHKFNENVKFFNTFDYYPSLTKFTDFRIETKAGLDVLLSKENKLSLKIGIDDRYDSTPEGQNRNDISYFALLAYNF